MINFSKVMESLREEEYIFEAVGDSGFDIEHKVAEHLLPKVHKQGGEFIHVDADNPNSKIAAKTDIYEKRSHKNAPDIGYSVKSKGDNNDPMKVHQTGAGAPAGLFSKLKMPIDTFNNYGDQIGDSMIRQALVMAFGSHKGTLSEAASSDNMFPNLTPDQRQILSSKKGKGDFLTPKEMKDNFGDHHAAIMRHLKKNKPELFQSLVRQQGSPIYGKNPYVDHDPQPVNKMIQHRRDAGTAPGDTSGRIDIMDISKDIFNDMDWFDDGERFYMSNQETDDIDKRMLDLYPITEENSKWAMKPGDDEGPRNSRDRSYVRGVREYGLPEPGHFKATMGTNPEWLHEFFRPEASYQMKDRGQRPPTFTRIQDSQPEFTPEPTSSPETKPVVDKLKGKLAGFLKKHGDNAIEMLKRIEDGKNNNSELSAEKQYEIDGDMAAFLNRKAKEEKDKPRIKKSLSGSSNIDDIPF